ncbi:MAG: amidohydrolase [Deltaproteobacteria bacterium]|nr:amidohydrolase [Deltaproteobacteria bacterium]
MERDLDAMPIVDVDTHFTEPPDFWMSRAPASLRDRAPRVERTPDGREQWVVDRDLVLGPVGYCVIRPDGSKANGRVSLDTFAEVHPGASQTAARLAVMDDFGITMQILYPNVLGFTGSFVMNVKDEALRNFCVTGYNDGVAAIQAESGGRLFPQAVLPIWDIDLSVRELERSHDELGLTGIVITDSPEVWGFPMLSEPHWDPLWAAAQERGLPVNFHIGGGGPMGAVWKSPSEGAWIAAMSTLADMGNMRCITNLIFSGLLDRFPKLNFVSVESGVGWIPFLIECAEYQMDENGVKGLGLRPREYFQRQIYASYWFENEIATALDKLGEDNLMFETDFPHPTCLYPGVREKVHQTLGKLEPRVQRKVLYETAARVYGLDVPGA